MISMIERLAITQLINATWILKYRIPNDSINKLRKMIGEPPEAIICEHDRDDSYYHKTIMNFSIDEKGKSDRTAVAIKIWNENIYDKIKTYPVRNKKHVFDYRRS